MTDTVLKLVDDMKKISDKLVYLSNSIQVPCFPIATVTTVSYKKYVNYMANIEHQLALLEEMATKASQSGGAAEEVRRRRARNFGRVINEFFAAPLGRGGHLIEHVSKPLLMTRLMKLLTNEDTVNFVAFLESGGGIDIYRTFELYVGAYAELLETDQSQYEFEEML